MKISRLVLAVAILAFLFTLSISTATAGSMGNGAAQRMKLVVTAFDAAAGTIEIKSGVDQSIHTYKINAVTKIMVGTVKGTSGQITAGEKVENYAAAGGQLPKDGQTLTLLWVSRAPAVANP